MISTQPEEQKRRDFIRPSGQFGDVKLGLILMASFCNFYAGEDNTQASVRLLESHCSKLWLERWQLGDVKLELILVASFCNFYPRKEHTQASPRLPESRCSKLWLFQSPWQVQIHIEIHYNCHEHLKFINWRLSTLSFLL